MNYEFLLNFGQYLVSDEFFHILAVIAVWGFCISGLDDLYIDFRYFLLWLSADRPEKKIRIQEAERLDQKPVAIMVPAWHEAAVINRMLMRNVANIDYLNYHIFIGAYPNDPATQAEVDRTIRHFRRLKEGRLKDRGVTMEVTRDDFIHKIVGPKPGPTNKADNLNAVYRRIEEVERELIAAGKLSGPFEIFILHDGEDVIHPKELKLFNYLMSNEPPEKRPQGELHRAQFDFVQLPVFPLEISILPTGEDLVPLSQAVKRVHADEPFSWFRAPRIGWEAFRLIYVVLRNLKRYTVSATYMDEFAEHHSKDMIVRRHIKGLVPSAGVGTGINRISLEKLAAAHPNRGIFNDIHLTEDYEISLLLKNMGARQHFVVEPVRMLKHRPGLIAGTREVDEFVATKEFFPDQVRRAIRQKARWIMGITYQTMFPREKGNPFTSFLKGWEGDLVVKYTLMRDRKALITNYINIIGYLVFLYCFTKITLVETIDYDWSYARIFPANSSIWWIVLFDTVIMVERFLQRFQAVLKIYGIKHASYFLVRTVFLIGLVLGNYINFMATISATWRYIQYVWKLKFGERKTKKPVRKAGRAADPVPEPESAAPAWGKTQHAYLADDQIREYVNRIGDLALRSRVMDEHQLGQALKRQKESELKLGEVFKEMGLLDDYGFSVLYAQQLAVPMREIDPVEIDPEALRQVPEDIAREHGLLPIAFDDLGNLIVATSEPVPDDVRPRLELLLKCKLKFIITFQSDIDFSMKRAYGKLAGQTTIKVARLGVYLLERGAISESQLSDALYMQKQSKKPLGEVLMETGAITAAHLDDYFRNTMGLGFERIDPYALNLKLLEQFSPSFCQVHLALPVGANGTEVKIAIANLALRDLKGALERRLNRPVEFVLAPEEDIRRAIVLGYRGIDPEKNRGWLLGERLLQEGVLDQTRLNDALRQQREKGLRLGEVLVAYGYVDEGDFLDVYAQDLFLPKIRLDSDPPEAKLAELFPLSEVRERRIVPILQDGDTLTFAIPYDFKTEDIRAIEERFSGYKLAFVMALKSQIGKTIDLLYGNVN